MRDVFEVIKIFIQNLPIAQEDNGYDKKVENFTSGTEETRC